MRALAVALLLTSTLLTACGEDPVTSSNRTTTTSSNNYATSTNNLNQTYSAATPLYTATESLATPAPTAALTPLKSGVEAKVVKATPHGLFTKTLEVGVEVKNFDATASSGWVIVTFQPSGELAYQQVSLPANGSNNLTFTSSKAAAEAEVSFRTRLL